MAHITMNGIKQKVQQVGFWNVKHQGSGWVVSGTIANAYRLELSGLYAILVYINALAVVYSIQSGNVLIGCDNIAALGKSLDCDRRVRSTVMHGDIIRAIQLTKDVITR